jgi:glycosyltransferase involved in cell wall biosynthesis
VCPYTDATQSGVAMTAFALGKPVIASNVGGFMDVINTGHNGILIPPKDSIALANAIELLITDENKLTNMSNNVAYFEKTNKNFSWQAIVKKLVSLYESIN